MPAPRNSVCAEIDVTVPRDLRGENSVENVPSSVHQCEGILYRGKIDRMMYNRYTSYIAYRYIDTYGKDIHIG